MRISAPEFSFAFNGFLKTAVLPMPFILDVILLLITLFLTFLILIILKLFEALKANTLWLLNNNMLHKVIDKINPIKYIKDRLSIFFFI